MGENRSLYVIFYSVTLTLVLKFLFKAYCHDILTNAILLSIFLKEEAKKKKSLNKYCQFLQFMTKIIMCKNPPFYANFFTL